MSTEQYLHVAVGVIKDPDGNILISLRHDKAHQGGLWEFPGGKLEVGENTEQALIRELKEELNITAEQLSPLIKIKHQYSDLNVLLDVYTITAFSGQARGLEGQEIKWVRQDQLKHYKFPAANRPIISAAGLPAEYAILNAHSLEQLMSDLQHLLDNNIKLIQARIKTLNTEQAEQFLQHALALCQNKSACLMLNSAVQINKKLDINGLHLTVNDLMQLKEKPSGYQWVAASCHNLAELKQAEKLGMDFAVLAPVLKTQTHPEAQPLGWEQFKNLVDKINIPVYALGGMQLSHQAHAQSLGAQGIAGIRCFLN